MGPDDRTETVPGHTPGVILATTNMFCRSGNHLRTFYWRISKDCQKPVSETVLPETRPQQTCRLLAIRWQPAP